MLPGYVLATVGRLPAVGAYPFFMIELISFIFENIFSLLPYNCDSYCCYYDVDNYY